MKFDNFGVIRRWNCWITLIKSKYKLRYSRVVTSNRISCKIKSKLRSLSKKRILASREVKLVTNVKSLFEKYETISTGN